MMGKIEAVSQGLPDYRGAQTDNRAVLSTEDAVMLAGGEIG